MLLLGAYTFINLKENSYLHDYMGLQFLPFFMIMGKVIEITLLLANFHL